MFVWIMRFGILEYGRAESSEFTEVGGRFM